jgi:hypothetical protein
LLVADLTEENAHLGNFQRVSSVLQYNTGLLQDNTWKPFDEIRELNAVLQVLEESSDRNARAPEHTGTAYALRITLDRGTRRPVNHRFDTIFPKLIVGLRKEPQYLAGVDWNVVEVPSSPQPTR